VSLKRGAYYRVAHVVYRSDLPHLGAIVKVKGLSPLVVELWRTGEEVFLLNAVLKPLHKEMCACPKWNFIHGWRPGCPIKE
jgi:hypothetical protein